MVRYRRVTKPIVHMLKERKGVEVKTRCLLDIKMKANQSIPDVGVTGWEKQVTCPGCVLPKR